MTAISNVTGRRTVSQLRPMFRQFLETLRETPLLAGWLVVGLLVAFFLDGWVGLAFGLINLFLLVLYALLIRWMTPDPPVPGNVKWPRLELALALGLFGLTLVVQLLDFEVWNIQPLQGWVRQFFTHLQVWFYSLRGIPAWAQQTLFMAFSTTIKQLIPTVSVIWLLKYRPREMGLAHPHWKLSTMLVGITAAFGLFTGVLFRAPFGQIVSLYLIGLFVNALPEELFFRGFLLPRLERFFKNPLNALVVSALLFNALHIPVDIHNGASPQMALLEVFSSAYPSGLIWGYLYLRTRSILPGTFWHAANVNLGFFMMR